MLALLELVAELRAAPPKNAGAEKPAHRQVLQDNARNNDEYASQVRQEFPGLALCSARLIGLAQASAWRVEIRFRTPDVMAWLSMGEENESSRNGRLGRLADHKKRWSAPRKR